MVKLTVYPKSKNEVTALKKYFETLGVAFEETLDASENDILKRLNKEQKQEWKHIKEALVLANDIDNGKVESKSFDSVDDLIKDLQDAI
jgi:hypothetical protein